MKYLVHNMNGIGDFCWILPYMQAIRKADPEAYIVLFASGNANRAEWERRMTMLPLQDAVNKLVYYNIHNPLQTLKCLWSIGYKRFDYSFVIITNDIGGFGSACVGIAAAKTSVGLDLPHLPQIHFTKTLQREPDHLSRRYYYAKMLEAVGIEPPKEGEICIPHEKLQPYLEKIGFAHLKKEKCVGIAVGCAPASAKVGREYKYNDVKSWMMDRWMALAEKLVRDGYKVVLLGGTAERKLLQQQKLEIPIGVIDIIGKVTVPESIAVVSTCKLLISGDTGMMHAAYDVGTPILTLFGGTDPQRTFPYSEKNQVISTGEPCVPCWGSKEVLECKDHKCLKKITVQMVYEKATEMLQDTTGQQA